MSQYTTTTIPLDDIEHGRVATVWRREWEAERRGYRIGYRDGWADRVSLPHLWSTRFTA
jgi:hypothetical protein